MLPKLSTKQLDFELKYIHAIDHSFSSKAQTDAGKVDALTRYLTVNLLTEMDNVLDKFSSMFNSFSCAVEQAEEAVTP